MLLIDQISNDKENTLKGLEKRGFKNLGVMISRNLKQLFIFMATLENLKIEFIN